MIYIATHKKIELPDLENYIPLRVGAEGGDTFGYCPDNTGDNISERNSSFCELTGLYWVWKNTKDDYKGLVHYRRYFAKSNLSRDIRDIYTYAEMKDLLKEADIVLPYVECFRETAKEELLIRSCTENIFNKLEYIVKEKYPDYGETFDEYFKQNRSVLFNMMFSKANIFDSYCSWLFDILFELEKTVDLSELDSYMQRLYGFVSERLLNVWVRKNRLRVKNTKVINLEMPMRERVILCRRRYTNQLRFFLRK